MTLIAKIRAFRLTESIMRSAAREAALNIVFSQHFGNECTAEFRKKVYRQFNLDKSESDVEFAEDLLETVETHRTELIKGIEDACHHYKENRINPMDKSILLIAMAEIVYFDDIPSVVSVSEAAGLARKYSTETSADFVNGVLAGVINK